MGAFLGISLWVALATVVPGLVTIAMVYGALVIVNPELVAPLLSAVTDASEWISASAAITIMVMTQAFGILLESLLVKNQCLGPKERKINIPEGIDLCLETKITLTPYHEYQGLYLLLAELQESEDSQGHLKRSLAQFFLTNNTLVSFLAGIVTALVIMVVEPGGAAFFNGSLFVAALLVLLWVSYEVALVRFEVMAKALWAARRRRLKSRESSVPSL
jgi:hypothetical protein